MATATERAPRAHDRIYIGGEWVKPDGSGALDVVNPTTEEVIGSVPDGSRSRCRPRSRCRACRIRDLVAHLRGGARGLDEADRRGAGRAHGRDRGGDRAGGRHAAEALADDPGRPADDDLRLDAELLSEMVWEEQVGNSLVVREPVGVVAAITPWNYPLHQIAAKVAPAIAAGCTVVLKPSQVAPLNAAAARGGDRRRRSARRRLQPRHGPRLGGRRGDRRAPRRRHDLLHGVDRRGTPRQRGGLRDRQARRARAGRQVAERDPRGRRPRARHGRTALPSAS